MRILVKGKLPEEKEYKHTCSTCHTVFVFKKKEVDVHSDQRDGNYYSCKCPLCSKTTYIYNLTLYTPDTIDPY